MDTDQLDQRLSKLNRLAVFGNQKTQTETPQQRALYRAMDKIQRELAQTATNTTYNQCESPGDTLYGSIAPCRKCAPCMRKRAYEWQQRAHREHKDHDRTWFLTLTYNQKNIAKANYKHATAYIKSLKDQGYRVAYMTAQEFGTEKGRYHVHILLHGESKLTKTVLRYKSKGKPNNWKNARWKYGNVDRKPPT